MCVLIGRLFHYSEEEVMELGAVLIGILMVVVILGLVAFAFTMTSWVLVYLWKEIGKTRRG